MLSASCCSWALPLCCMAVRMAVYWASSVSVGMPVTPSRMRPQTASSVRVSVMSAEVTAADPAGTEIVHRPSSYWLWFCRMSGG